MKRILTVVFTLAILIPGFGANAQLPFVQVFFDDDGTVSSRDCPPEMVMDTLTVFAFNFDMWLSGIEYMIEYSPALSFCGDIVEGRVRIVGNSEYGIEIEFRDPVEAQTKFLVQKACVIWMCTDCAGFLDTHNFVLTNPNTGRLGVIRYPDLAFINVAGFTSTTCPWVLPTRPTTWGQVKSLYQR